MQERYLNHAVLYSQFRRLAGPSQTRPGFDTNPPEDRPERIPAEKKRRLGRRRNRGSRAENMTTLEECVNELNRLLKSMTLHLHPEFNSFEKNIQPVSIDQNQHRSGIYCLPLLPVLNDRIRLTHTA